MWIQLKNLLTNYTFITPIIAWFSAQLIKMVITLIKDKQFKPLLILFSSGGMPSSHTATVSSLFAASALQYGFGSFEFSVSFILAMVVMTDAVGVRRETGKQAKVLNRIMEELFSGDAERSDRALKELVGHSPLQVAMGALVGISTAIIIAFAMKIIV